MGEDRTAPYRTHGDTPSSTRVSVDGAARALGVTIDAIRKRVQRGTIPHERDESGRVWVFLEAARTMQGKSSTIRDNDQDKSGTMLDNDQDRTGHIRRELLKAKEETIDGLKERVDSLERQLEAERAANRENRRLLAAALERIPAIEAPRDEPRDAPETARQDAGGVEDRTERVAAQTDAQRRSWFVRFFFGP